MSVIIIGMGALNYDPYPAGSLGVSNAIVNSADASGGVAITDAPAAGMKIRIVQLIISVNTALAVSLKEETSGTVLWGPYYFPANVGPAVLPIRNIKTAVANKKILVFTNASGGITVEPYWNSEA